MDATREYMAQCQCNRQNNFPNLLSLALLCPKEILERASAIRSLIGGGGGMRVTTGDEYTVVRYVEQCKAGKETGNRLHWLGNIWSPDFP